MLNKKYWLRPFDRQEVLRQYADEPDNVGWFLWSWVKWSILSAIVGSGAFLVAFGGLLLVIDGDKTPDLLSAKALAVLVFLLIMGLVGGAAIGRLQLRAMRPRTGELPAWVVVAAVSSACSLVIMGVLAIRDQDATNFDTPRGLGLATTVLVVIAEWIVLQGRFRLGWLWLVANLAIALPWRGLEWLRPEMTSNELLGFLQTAVTIVLGGWALWQMTRERVATLSEK